MHSGHIIGLATCLTYLHAPTPGAQVRASLCTGGHHHLAAGRDRDHNSDDRGRHTRGRPYFMWMSYTRKRQAVYMGGLGLYGVPILYELTSIRYAQRDSGQREWLAKRLSVSVGWQLESVSQSVG